MRDEETRSRPFAKALRNRMTDAETILWSRLRMWCTYGRIFRRQHPIGPYIADFACVRAKLVVELDGGGHGADDQVAYDQRRDAYLKSRGWRVIRIPNDEVFKNLDTILDLIAVSIPSPVR